jgi:hypothetical protein
MWWFIGFVLVLLFAAAGWVDWKRGRVPGGPGAGQPPGPGWKYHDQSQGGSGAGGLGGVGGGGG